MWNYLEICYRWKTRRSLFTWKDWQTDVPMNVFIHSHFPPETHKKEAVLKLNRRSLQREGHLFPLSNHCVVAITHWTMAMCTTIPLPDGISRQGWDFTYIIICLIFQVENRRIYPQFWVNQHLSGDFNLYQSLIWPIMSHFMGAFIVKVSSHK